uniref:Uncharacterized protein n=1 Tax=Arundo donax TaxID=35708 RepID=A0A0A9EDS2_ARUDO
MFRDTKLQGQQSVPFGDNLGQKTGSLSKKLLLLQLKHLFTNIMGVRINIINLKHQWLKNLKLVIHTDFCSPRWVQIF